LWDRGNLFAELNSNATAIMGEYSYYPGADHLHAFAKGNTIYYAHTDGVGNVRALTDSMSTLAATYKYEVGGSNAGTTNPAGLGNDQRARFKGALRIYDDIELYYMRNRWYEPQSGRFLSEDPIGLVGGLNSYMFVGGDPVNGRDPTGLDQCVTIDSVQFVKPDGTPLTGYAMRDCYPNSERALAGMLLNEILSGLSAPGYSPSGWGLAAGVGGAGDEEQNPAADEDEPSVRECVTDKTRPVREFLSDHKDLVLGGITGLGVRLFVGGMANARGTQLRNFKGRPVLGNAMRGAGQFLLKRSLQSVLVTAVFGASYIGTTWALCNAGL
jgi:RHS repeat-associated protein